MRNGDSFYLRVSVTKFVKILPLWQKIILVNFIWLIFYLVKFLTTLAENKCYLTIFHFCKWPNNENLVTLPRGAAKTLVTLTNDHFKPALITD